jgi:fused signal recognition particle receptor
MNPLIIGAILVVALIVVVLVVASLKRGKKQIGESESKPPSKGPLQAEEKPDLKALEEPPSKTEEEEAQKVSESGEPPRPETAKIVPPSEEEAEGLETPPGVKLDEEAETKAVAELEKERRERKLKRLRQGLAPTRSGLFAKIGALFKSKKEIDPSIIEEVEEVLLTSDVGAKTTETLLSSIRAALDTDELSDSKAAWNLLKEAIKEILTIDAPPIDIHSDKPFVIMVVGVNGVGKTTTIGKLATTFAENGQKVVLAAADTFRAAAVNQLTIWGRRADAEVVKSKEGADPSSVVFDAIKRAKEIDADIVIADTAGRLHTQQPLMEELKKIHRVIGKAHENAPHEVLLVLDATTGQNAIQQVSMFKETLDITGLVLTKLDGTAKGGVIIGICHEHSIPVRYIGIGEARDDLREFEVSDFVDALFF